MEFTKINPLALGVTLSILSALGSFCIGLGVFFFYAGKPIVAMIGDIYITYTPSVANAGLGALFVLINSFFACYIAAWLYNFLLDYIR